MRDPRRAMSCWLIESEVCPVITLFPLSSPCENRTRVRMLIPRMSWSASLSLYSSADLLHFALARPLCRSDKRREVQAIEHALENGADKDTLQKRQGHLGRDREVGLPTKGRLHRPDRDGRVITRVAPHKLQQWFGRISIGKTHML